MAQQPIFFTPEVIMSLPPGRRADAQVPGLYVQVTPSGRSWLFRYDYQKRCTWMGLGKVDTASLGKDILKARSKAREARAQLVAGINPLEAKREAAAAAKGPSIVDAPKTFKDAAREYIRVHHHEWKSPIHARQWEQLLDDYTLPVIGNTLVADVGPADVKRILQPLWKDKREVARKLCGKIVMVLNLAKSEGWRTAPTDFASVKVMSATLGKLKQRPKHHPAMPYKDVPGFMAKLDARGDDVPSLAFRWLILTGTRSAEARCPTWAEIDRDARTWTIPEHRMKGGAPHLVPLSDGALDVLDKVKRRQGCEFVFVAQGSEPVTETSLRNILREFGYDKRAASLHGFRSSLRDWTAVQGIDDAVAEAAIAHYSKAVLGTLAGSGANIATMKAYKRTTYYEARVAVMQEWDYFLRFGVPG